MKKIILILSCFFILSISSCIKKYSCKCTTTLSASGYYPKETTTIEPLEKRISKTKAQETCDHTAKQVQENTKLLYSSWIEVSSKCILKDN